MSWKQEILRIPGLGSILHGLHAIVHLNRTRAQIAADIAQLHHLRIEYADHLAQKFQEQQVRNDAFAAQHQVDAELLTQLRQNLAQQAQYLEQQAHQLSQQAQGLAQAGLDIADIRTFSQDIEARVSGLTVELRHKRAAVPPALAPALAISSAPLAADPKMTENAFDMAAFYVEFEDKFRGTRADIQARLEVYLPYLQPLIGDAGAQVVDVGCGRGEWLELLGRHGIRATGIDLNEVMVELCRDVGLKAECADAVAYLNSLPEGSLAAVTGFHIIEHLPFELLVALFDAALWALRPDGLLIFETPNPENLIVGSCNFYTDPTHQRPIVPFVAQFMARQRGFSHAEILPLHPYPENYHLIDDGEVARRLNEVLYGPQDYAVLAWNRAKN
ncbi:MAG: class I SAM-dependent methyltransferase [Glaciimonas sp.]|nr:class I SAM-dependent methyltransferase [Glaciimonas sp.]